MKSKKLDQRAKTLVKDDVTSTAITSTPLTSANIALHQQQHLNMNLMQQQQQQQFPLGSCSSSEDGSM
jgi:hypothetical protein